MSSFVWFRANFTLTFEAQFNGTREKDYVQSSFRYKIMNFKLFHELVGEFVGDSSVKETEYVQISYAG